MSDDNCQIFICHLPKDITRNELEEEFEEFGSIRKIEIKNKFAFIEYKNAKSAKKAIIKMDGNKVFGNRIIVQNAYKGERKKEKYKNADNISNSEKSNNRRKYKNECFICGKNGHWAKDCPEKFSKNNLRCYYCDQKGHLKRDCPLKKNCNRGSRYKKRKYSYHSKSYFSSSYSRSRSRSLNSRSSYSSKSYSSDSSYSKSSSYSRRSHSKKN